MFTAYGEDHEACEMIEVTRKRKGAKGGKKKKKDPKKRKDKDWRFDDVWSWAS